MPATDIEQIQRDYAALGELAKRKFGQPAKMSDHDAIWNVVYLAFRYRAFITKISGYTTTIPKIAAWARSVLAEKLSDEEAAA